jgi:hypothetical protein
VPSIVWADITMDFVEGFPRVNGKLVVLTVVDRFSKYGHFIALGHLYTATTIARAFFDNNVRLHGIPYSIVSDRDPVFTSQFWGELFRLAGVKLQYSSAFHPQSDGQSEAVNKVIIMLLRCLSNDCPATGSNGFHGWSSAPTPGTNLPSRRHRSRLCTGVTHHPYAPTLLGRHGCQPFTSS